MTAILGVVEFQTPVYKDGRGLFTSPLREPDFEAAVGRKMFPVKDISYNVSGRGVLRGIQDTKVPMIFALFGYWIIGIGVGALLAFPMGLHGVGIWFGLAAGLGTVAILLIARWSLRDRLGLVLR